MRLYADTIKPSSNDIVDFCLELIHSLTPYHPNKLKSGNKSIQIFQFTIVLLLFKAVID